MEATNGEMQFVKGFNHGYILAEYEPALAKQLAKSNMTKNDLHRWFCFRLA